MTTQTNSKLTITKPSALELRITRDLRAPRHLVFEAMSKPEHLRNWYGPRSMKMTVCEVDLRVGGAWRCVQQAPDGSEHAFSGVFKEIVPGERIVQTEGYEAMPGHDYLNTTRLTERDGVTTVEVTLLYQRTEDREGHLAAGMEPGMSESYDRLQELLTSTDTSDREIVTIRVVAAPRDLVFGVFTDPVHIGEWWGPNGFTSTVEKMDVRPGGDWRFVMHGPDGTDYPNHVRYVDVHAPERLVLDQGVDLDTGAPHFRNIITFETVADGRTRVTMRGVFPTTAARAAVAGFAVDGARQNLERMAVRVAGQQVMQDPTALNLSRTFHAPLAHVWAAYTEPEHLMQWWGPKGVTMKVAKMDLRPQGVFHYSYEMTPGQTTWGIFRYHAVSPKNRLVFTSSFADEAGNAVRAPFAPDFPLQVLNILTFAEHDGLTTLSMRGMPFEGTPAEQAFFANMHANIQQGFKGTLDSLEAHLATM